MLKITKTIALLALVVGFTACDSAKEKKTASGLTYTLIAEGEGDMPKDGNYLLLNMIYKDGGDSTWIDTQERGFPMVILKQDSVWKNSQGSIEQVFIDLKPGDSVKFEVKAADLFSKTWKSPIPPGIDSTGMFKFIIGVENSFDEAGFQVWQKDMMAKQQAEAEKDAEEQLAKDIETIDAYLAENEIEAEKADSGIRYVITEAGNGEQAVAGDTVKVHYAGNVLNGAFFDTSIKSIAQEKGLYDERREPYEPYAIKLGAGSVIKGWDVGLTYLKEGDKATLYIPSPMAYGARARSAEIGPNSILVFDVELVDVKKNEASK